MSPVNTDTSFIENRAPNVAVQFRDRVHQSPSRTAYSYPAADGQPWTEMTWKETGDRVEKLAAGLLALGLGSEQRVGIASGTRVEWILADLAVMCAGGATTTVYPSTMAEDVAYIVADSECRVLFAEDDEQLAKLKSHRTELPHLEKVVLFDGAADGDWVIGLEDLSTLGEKHLAENADAVTLTDPDALPVYPLWDDPGFEQILPPSMDIAGAAGRQCEGFLDDVEVWKHKTRIDNPLLTEEDGAVYQHRRWYEQFYVDAADVTDDMVNRFELEVDTTHAYGMWQQEVNENLRRRGELAQGVASTP